MLSMLSRTPARLSIAHAPLARSICVRFKASAASAASAALPAAVKKATPLLSRNQLIAGGTVSALVAQSIFGSGADYFEYRFIVENKNADDVACFYSGEDFMEIYTIFPFLADFFWRGAKFDEKGIAHTYGLPGEIQVNMVFSEGEAEGSGEVDWFNKHERFRDVFFGYTCWDQCTNFGFQRIGDGKIECYHHGEYFVGYLPVVSLLVKFIFQIQARWVAWATEHHLNHHAFTASSEEEEAVENLSRANHTWYLLQYFFWRDFKAMCTTALGFGTGDGDGDEGVSFLSREHGGRGGTTEPQLPIPTKRADVMLQLRENVKMDEALGNVGGVPDLNGPEGGNALLRAQKSAHMKLQMKKTVLRNTPTGETD